MQAVWALGNIAGDSPKCRDFVLGHNALPPLLEQLKEGSKISMLRNATWTLSNFCRGKPSPNFTIVGAWVRLWIPAWTGCEVPVGRLVACVAVSRNGLTLSGSTSLLPLPACRHATRCPRWRA